MNIPLKLFLNLAFLIVLLWGVALFVSKKTSEALQAAIEDGSKKQTYAIMHEIDRLMHTRITNWMAYVNSPLVQQELRKSNQALEQVTAPQDLIDERDRDWITARKNGESTPLMDELIHNPLALDLQNLLEQLELSNGYRVFGEAFITNRYGANAAQSNFTSDYRQDDEEWWQSAQRNKIHVTDLEYDESAGVYSTDICLRIDDNAGNLLGVLKAVLNIREVVGIVDEFHDSQQGYQARQLILFTNTRKVVHRSNYKIDSEPLQDGSAFFPTGILGKVNKSVLVDVVTDSRSRQSFMRAYAPSHGYAEFKGLGWILMLEHDADEVLMPVRKMRAQILAIASAATIVAILFGGALAYSISNRVNRLTEATSRVSKGDMSTRVGLKGRDELAQLSRAFDSMIERLDRAHNEIKKNALQLQEKNLNLEKEIEERKHAESVRAKLEAQLRQKHKLEAVGQLAAGIAHEINTPIQFITDNARFLQNSFQDIDRLFVRCAQQPDCASASGDQGCAAELTALCAEIDVNYLREEIPKALSQSLDGLNHVAHIVLAMKEFSHPGVSGVQAVDLNHAIKNTITVCRNEWKYVAQMQTELEDNLPAVSGHPGEINQALLNLIINAAHAIEDKLRKLNRTELGMITIRTRRREHEVELSVEDTGCGIPDNIRDKIFDPFFTTKEVGKGTGQGLSIVYNVIVQKLGGTIEIESEVGTGTTFFLRVPQLELNHEQSPHPDCEIATTPSLGVS